MIPRPIALGLALCSDVIIEEGTRNATLVKTFTKMFVDRFPSLPRSFAAFAALTDGQGSGIVDLALTRLETDEVIYTHQGRLDFPDRQTEVRVLFRIAKCAFPAPGRYQAILLVDREWVAQRGFEIAGRGP